ncbi:hypothetical protein MD484_g5959, partial [Candolleomyces efflorescens]
METSASRPPCDSDLTPLDLPGRHPRMPQLFQAKSHPLHPASNSGRTYVYYTRPTEARMRELVQAGEAIPVEGMTESALGSAGFLKVEKGDYVFTRNELGSRNAKDDVAVCYVVGPELRCKKKMQALDCARDKFIGPVDEITEDSVLFERLKPKPKPVKEGTRCWALGTTLEPNTNIEAPCANGKSNEGEREYHEIVRDLVVASTSLAMEDVAHAPEGIREVLQSEFERHGGAPLGCEDNFAYHAVQCNLAYAGKSMEAQMGRYAGIHRDERDCPGHYSNMITCSKLPPNYDPPRMILPGLGLYADMSDFVGFTFQARHEHVEDSFANFLRDGPWIMSDAGFIPYVGRVAYQVVRYLLMQTHARFDFEVDPALFAGSITYKSSDGTRSSVPEWEMAPTVQPNPENERQVKREASESRFKEHLFKHGSMIPSSFNNNGWIKEEAAKRYGSAVGTERFREGSTMNLRTKDPCNTTSVEGHVTKCGARENDRLKQNAGPAGSAGNSRTYLPSRKRKRVFDEIDVDVEDEGGLAEEEGRDCDEDSGKQGLFQNELHPTGGARFRKRIKKSAPTKENKQFKFLQMLSGEALEDEILQLRRETQVIERVQAAKVDLDQLKETIDHANDAVERGGVGNRALRGIGAIMEDAHRLSAHINLTSAKLRGLRQSLIKAETSIRRWIEGPVADQAQRAAEKGRSSGHGANQSWVSKVTNHVIEMLVSKLGRRIFRARDYGLAWDRVMVIENRHTSRNMLRGQADTARTAVEMTLTIVEGWVNADKLCHKRQAWFASIVEDVMGEEALTMNIVWNLYQDVKPAHIMPGNSGYRHPTVKDTEEFRRSLEGHSVLDEDHREGQLFMMYKQLLNGQLSAVDVVKQLPSVSFKWSATLEMIRLATINDNEEEVEEPSPYFDKLQADPHTYHPMRERSQGRAKWRQVLADISGPISLEAIFSLIAWRVYPQVFSWHPDARMLYKSPDEFLKAYESITKTEPSIKTRKAVDKFWDSLQEIRWSSFADTYPTFDQCYQNFRPNGHLETRLFPGLSRTDAFDVTCDLTYAGFCQPPSTADVARYIVHMNQGAMAGMKALRLMDNKKSDIETKRQNVHQALLEVGELLRDVAEYAAYEDETAKEIGLQLYQEGEMDPIGIEHFLRTLSHGIKYLT